MRFEGKKGEDVIYEITLCKYLDPDNDLPIDQSIRVLVCSISSVRDH